MRYCADFSRCFLDRPLEEQFALAAEAGFALVEIPQPYDVNVQDVVNLLTRFELQLAMLPCPPPNYAGGQPGCPATPGMEARFQTDLKRALRYARALNVDRIQLRLSGPLNPENRDSFKANMLWAIKELDGQILSICADQLPTPDGKLGQGPSKVVEWIGGLEVPALRLRFDAVPCWENGEDPLTFWGDIAAHVVHVNLVPRKAEGDKYRARQLAFLKCLEDTKFAGSVAIDKLP